ncbi:dTMP kinase [Pilimelia anulata]|uniref:Thymidylate kinase n=1 Tax=Pilimelia anulata TaxID=53371 RepID=A0A8J3B5V1_9ACTN|nr:dTMP kinase [Pilimelia anulata]GGJ95898.1 dTMP kinase [Pilimelia anulata]
MLRIRPFRRLWLVLGVASLGDWLGLLATAAFASAQVSGSVAQGLAFSSVIAVRLLPALVLGPVAGVLADRWDRRYTMVVCDLLRFVLFASIPLGAVVLDDGASIVGWAAFATFLIESVTLVWLPAKEAAVPNLIPRSRLEVSNQLTLITTYGITPVLAAAGLSVLDRALRSAVQTPPDWAEPANLALYFNAVSRLALALVVFFGIREISGRTYPEPGDGRTSMLRQFVDGWTYIGRTRMVRGLVLGILGAFACGGAVIGVAKFFAVSLGAGDAAFYMLFGALFVGLAAGIGAGPALVRALSRRRWFGMSIVLAGASVFILAMSVHLAVALAGAVLVGTGAGMAFLSGTTLLGGEVGDDVRGRVFAFVQTATRVVLILAIGLSGAFVGIGGSHEFHLGDATFSVSATRALLFVAGLLGIFAGISAFRQMDDKPGVPVLRDLWWSVRGRPLSPAQPVAGPGLFVVFEGGEGVGKSTQVSALAEALREAGHRTTVTREPGATPVGRRIRELLLERSDAPVTPRAEALLYAADRAHHVATVVRPALDRGEIVISDRYIDSSLAYQGAGRTLSADDVAWVSDWATGGLKPDLVILLDLDPAVGLRRAADRGAPDRLERESLAFHGRVREAFLDLAAADRARYLVVDAAMPVAEVAAAIHERVADLVDTAGTALALAGAPR